jgi:hypothetical protein
VKGRESVQLLFRPKAPRLRRGDRSTCLYRDCAVVVTGWADARIPWPRCRPVGLPCSHPSLQADEELACTIRHESAAALRRWWGVSAAAVTRWRRAIGVGRVNCEGTHRLRCAASEAGAARTRGRRRGRRPDRPHGLRRRRHAPQAEGAQVPRPEREGRRG